MTSIVSHQTVRLRRGKHASPEKGACVMELASMLAGEPFSDHPVSVCPMIGAYLRAVNDLVDDDERQLLIPYGAAIVGSGGSRPALRARISACSQLIRRIERLSSARAALLRWAFSLDAIGAICARSSLLFGPSYAFAVADVLLELGSGRRAGEEAATPGLGLGPAPEALPRVGQR